MKPARHSERAFSVDSFLRPDECKRLLEIAERAGFSAEEYGRAINDTCHEDAAVTAETKFVLKSVLLGAAAPHTPLAQTPI